MMAVLAVYARQGRLPVSVAQAGIIWLYRRLRRASVPRPRMQALDYADALDEDSFRHDFRFTRDQVQQLQQALLIPSSINAGRFTGSGRLALLLLLSYLAWPLRMQTLAQKFGVSRRRCSALLHFMAEYLLRTWGHLLRMKNGTFLTTARLDQ